MPGFQNPPDSEIRALLERVRRIAVVGLSPKTHRASHRVARCRLEVGYDVIPVYPEGDLSLGQKAYRHIKDVPGPVDLVDVFRRSEFLSGVFDDVIEAGVAAIWTQLGCIDYGAAERARAAGLTVVMNRCLMVEHGRLLA